jgi:hypothetical protein
MLLIALFFNLFHSFRRIVESRGEITPQRTAQIVLFSLVLIPYTAGLFLRYLTAEVFAFAFHIFHMFAHVILLLSLIYQYDPSTFIYVYILLLLMGMFRLVSLVW